MGLKELLWGPSSSGLTADDREFLTDMMARIEQLEKEHEEFREQLIILSKNVGETATMVGVVAAAHADVARDMNTIFNTLSQAMELAGQEVESGSSLSNYMVPIRGNGDDDDPTWN